MIVWIAPVLGFLRSALPYALLFLRSIPDLLAPKPTPAASPYVPPFTGGQSATTYKVFVLTKKYSKYDAGGQWGYRYLYCQFGKDFGITVTSPDLKYPPTSIANITGSILSIYVNPSDGKIYYKNTAFPNGKLLTDFESTTEIEYQHQILSISFERLDGLADTGGNLPNPSPSPSIPDDGLFNPQNPTIGDDNGTINPASIVLAPALPLVLVSAILAGYSAAMAAAQAALSALEAIKKLAEGFDALKDLWDKLREFLNEWEKNRPKKRDVVRQTYGQISGDGALDFFPNNNTKFQAIQLDVIITNIPVGSGRYFGSLSPSRYRFKELGYVAFYSANQGILEVHSIQFKRTSYQIPELAIGFIYHLGLDEQIKGYSFGTFSVEKT